MKSLKVPVTTICVLTVPNVSTYPDLAHSTNAPVPIATSASIAPSVSIHAAITNARTEPCAHQTLTIVHCTTANAQRVSPDSSVRTSTLLAAVTDARMAVSVFRPIMALVPSTLVRAVDASLANSVKLNVTHVLTAHAETMPSVQLFLAHVPPTPANVKDASPDTTARSLLATRVPTSHVKTVVFVA